MTTPTEDRLRELFRRADAELGTEPLDPEGTLRRARARRTRRIGVGAAALVAVVALVVGAVVGTPEVLRITPATDGEGEALHGRTFYSVSVTEGGEPRPLAPDTRLRVVFWEVDGSDWMAWNPGCNEHAGPIEITEERLRDDPSRKERGRSTTVLCRGEVGEQERWTNRFFRSEPAWELEGDRLVLTSGETVIELEEDDLGVTVRELQERWNENVRDGGFPALAVDDRDLGGSQPSEQFSGYSKFADWGSITLNGDVNSDGAIYEVNARTESLRFYVDVRNAWRILIRTVSPQLAWGDDVDGVLRDLGVHEGEDEPRGSNEVVTTVRDDVRYGLSIERDLETGRVDGLTLFARPVRAHSAPPPR